MTKSLSPYIQFLGITSIILAIAQPTTPLEIFKETPHILFLCAPGDEDSAKQIADCVEPFFKELSALFNHTYSTAIIVSIYPNIASFHTAIGQPDAPEWVIGQSDTQSIMGVSPSNPGQYHGYDSILRSYKVNLASVFIEDMYTHHQSIPRWLHQGVALYIAQFFDPEKVTANLAQDLAKLPTIAQLDAIEKCDTMTFDQHNGFHVSYSLVRFIDKHWGWQTLLRLLNEYDNFEKIIGISKEEFEKQWKAHIPLLTQE